MTSTVIWLCLSERWKWIAHSSDDKRGFSIEIFKIPDFQDVIPGLRIDFPYWWIRKSVPPLPGLDPFSLTSCWQHLSCCSSRRTGCGPPTCGGVRSWSSGCRSCCRDRYIFTYEICTWKTSWTVFLTRALFVSSFELLDTPLITFREITFNFLGSKIGNFGVREVPWVNRSSVTEHLCF